MKNEVKVAPNMMGLDVLSESEAALKLGLSRITLQRARKRGELGFYKIGRRVVYSINNHLVAFLNRLERNSTSRVRSNEEQG